MLFPSPCVSTWTFLWEMVAGKKKITIRMTTIVMTMTAMEIDAFLTCPFVYATYAVCDEMKSRASTRFLNPIDLKDHN